MSENEYSDNLYFVCLVHIVGEEDQEYWAYLLVPSKNYMEFCAQRENAGQYDDFDIEAYGEIIDYGPGKSPPEHLKQNLAERLQLDQDFEIQFESLTKNIEKLFDAE